MQGKPPRRLLQAINKAPAKDVNFYSLCKSSACISHGNFCPFIPTLPDSVLVQTSAESIYYIIYKAVQDLDLPRSICKDRKQGLLSCQTQRSHFDVVSFSFFSLIFNQQIKLYIFMGYNIMLLNMYIMWSG